MIRENLIIPLIFLPPQYKIQLYIYIFIYSIYAVTWCSYLVRVYIYIYICVCTKNYVLRCRALLAEQDRVWKLNHLICMHCLEFTSIKYDYELY